MGKRKKKAPAKKATAKAPAKKKAPPKKKRPPKKVRGTQTLTPPEPATLERVQEIIDAPTQKMVTKPRSSSVEPPEENDAMRYLRYYAGLHYTTDLRGTTIEQMSKHPVYGAASIEVLYRWSSLDRWKERREQNMQNWRRAIENKIGSELVKARTENLKNIQDVFDKLMHKILKGRLKTRSLEGAVSAMVRLADLMDDWNEKLSRAIIPDMPAAPATLAGAGDEIQTRPRLTKEEARAAASVILDTRRKEMRAKHARMEAAKEDKKRPDLAVVQESDGV